MMSRDNIQHLDAFKRISPSGQKIFAQGLSIITTLQSAVLLSKGQPVSGAYLVIDGRLRVFTIAPNGTEATLYFIDPGEACVLAINCLFNDLLYPAWVQSETKSTIAVIPGAVYRKLFESEVVVQNLTIQALSTLVYRLMAELELVHSTNHKQRLAQFILTHASGDGSLRMTQQQIAKHQGTTREVIARLIQEFVAQGFVRSRRGVIEISNLFGLRRVHAPDYCVSQATPRAARSGNAWE